MSISYSSQGKQFGSLPYTCILPLFSLCVASLGAANYLAQPFGIHLSPLFALPVCLASWHSNFRIGLAAAVVSALISVGTGIEVASMAPPDTAGNLAIHAASFAAIAAIASDFRARYERERFAARRDFVTGILNRQAFERKAQAILNIAGARGWPMLLAYLDLDGFKSVNDRHGHEAGDTVLKHFGVAGRAVLRREDCFGRMGGDEFALLMKLPSIEEGQQVAEKLHKRFSAALADTGHAVTCSMGALAIEPDVGAVQMEELMRSVDCLMYAVKNGGKNGLRYTTVAHFADKGSSPPAAGGKTPLIWSQPNQDAHDIVEVYQDDR